MVSDSIHVEKKKKKVRMKVVKKKREIFLFLQLIPETSKVLRQLTNKT